ncbi:hypothetical protein UlMin_032247 [Ulmus minor]
MDLGNNWLNGSIPKALTDLSQLQCLVLSHNNLSGSIPSKSSSYFRQVNIPDLSFIQHRGVFDLSHNSLSGSIPDVLGECVILVDLLISNNMLSGEFGDSLKLQGLYLGNNQLTRSIPGSLGHLSSLVKLNLTSNKLSGSVPMSFGSLKGLTHLDLSSNEINGELLSLSSLQNLVGLYVQQNRLSGQVDQLFLNSIAWKIETMNLSNNFFDGELPKSLGNLSYLTFLDLHANAFRGYLDVSRNKLSGQIPENLCSLTNLFYLNLADNRLEGPIPRSGICQNLSKTSLAGNTRLCGRILDLDCKSFGKSTSLNAWGLAGVILGSSLITLVAAFALLRCISKNSKHRDSEETEESKLNTFLDHNLYFLSNSRSKEPLSINVPMFEQPLLKLTLADILEATNNFCKTNIIRDGGFGTVYKATLPDGKTVAVKKLSEAKTQGQREFIAEMETLGKVKQQNLVLLLGYYSIGEEKLLVYEYMVNGSLDLWLRNRSGALEVLASLHHGFIPHIIHWDLKPSNILLNEDFEAKVSDFGLARLISACESQVSIEIAGTFGYIPPKYGHSGRSTTRGDVYSFGVILLELVTGKEPTRSDFKEIKGGNLVGWVS